MGLGNIVLGDIKNLGLANTFLSIKESRNRDGKMES